MTEQHSSKSRNISRSSRSRSSRSSAPYSSVPSPLSSCWGTSDKVFLILRAESLAWGLGNQHSRITWQSECCSIYSCSFSLSLNISFSSSFCWWCSCPSPWPDSVAGPPAATPPSAGACTPAHTPLLASPLWSGRGLPGGGQLVWVVGK